MSLRTAGLSCRGGREVAGISNPDVHRDDTTFNLYGRTKRIDVTGGTYVTPVTQVPTDNALLDTKP